MVILAALEVYIWLASGATIWAVSGNGEIASNISIIIGYVAIAVIYGVVWLGFWSVLYKNGIRWFYFRIAFSILPLIAALLMFDPRPDPMAMIPMSKQPVFSCLVTGIILLPIYSMLIYRFILKVSVNRVRNTILVCFVTIVIGSLIFSAGWNIMHVIYKYSECELKNIIRI